MSMIKIAFVNVIIDKNNFIFIEYSCYFIDLSDEKNRLADQILLNG